MVQPSRRDRHGRRRGGHDSHARLRHRRLGWTIGQDPGGRLRRTSHHLAASPRRPVLGHFLLGDIRRLDRGHLRVLAVPRDLDLGGVGRVLVGDLRRLRRHDSGQGERPCEHEKFANHETLLHENNAGPRAGTRRPDHSRANTKPRARLRAIVLSQLNTVSDAVSTNRAAVRHAYSNVSATTSSASAVSTRIPYARAYTVWP